MKFLTPTSESISNHNPDLPSFSTGRVGNRPCSGVGFFQRALELQKKYGKGKNISNTLQTNGTLIDEAWCTFLSENKFLVGLSMDGPEAVHDAYRLDKDGRPTLSRVVKCAEYDEETWRGGKYSCHRE